MGLLGAVLMVDGRPGQGGGMDLVHLAVGCAVGHKFIVTLTWLLATTQGSQILWHMGQTQRLCLGPHTVAAPHLCL